MSGRTRFRKLREEIERDPVRQARMDETRKAYDALLHTTAELTILSSRRLPRNRS